MRPALFLLVLAFTSGCSGGDLAGSNTGDERAAAADTLVLGMTADIQGWIPGIQPEYQGWPGEAVWDTLLRADEFGTPLPALATSWEISDDYRSITLKLRENVVFSDGSPVDAADVAASFEHISHYLRRFEGVSVEELDPLTVRIAWPTPRPLIGMLMSLVKISSSEWIAAGELNDLPLGSGPYVPDVARTIRGATYVFKRNPDHWDTEHFPFEQLVIKVFASETSALNALKTGQIDGTLISQTTVEEARRSGLQVVTMRGKATRLVITDHLGEVIPALGDVRVRRAMNRVFDRPAMATYLYRGYADPAYQIFRPGSDAYLEGLGDPYPYDVAAGRALMAEAGYGEGFELQLPHMEGQNHDLLFPYIIQQLGLLEIRVEQVNLSGPNAIPDILSGRFPVVAWELGNFGESLQDMEDYVLSSGIWNLLQQPDPIIDALWDQVVRGGAGQRVAAQRAINRYVTEQAWFVPMVYPDGFYAHSDKVRIEQVSDFQGLVPRLVDFRKGGSR